MASNEIMGASGIRLGGCGAPWSDQVEDYGMPITIGGLTKIRPEGGWARIPFLWCRFFAGVESKLLMRTLAFGGWECYGDFGCFQENHSFWAANFGRKTWHVGGSQGRASL
jgi:hypothetical protein